jgi:arylsulfatase A-like enzyme
VPVIFFGAGVSPGVHDSAATPADIAPTLAALAGVRFAATDGQPLLKRTTLSESRKPAAESR